KLIQTRDYIRECGGNPKDVSFFGQESIGTTWSICKMNMLLHGISDADIRQEDTIRRPQHKAESNELKRYDRVLANPPFSQNYIKKDIEYPGRFAVWLPEKGKKADLMFVQHMLAVLKADGKMATIMPHGVLFRGGEEREARKHFIERGWLEAVISLPAGLFYGTGIPACVLVMNKKGATDRKHVFFINSDREYREGKAQNFLRSEDISKIVHVYRERKTLEGYARLVPVKEIEAEEYNCNIRRYVDNAPPPEPHDVRAHLHGGIPIVEIEAQAHFWTNYPGLRERVFGPRQKDKTYADFLPAVIDRRVLADLVKIDPGVTNAHARFLDTLELWWKDNLPLIEALAPKNGKRGNVYELRRTLLASAAKVFAKQDLLTDHQIRGALASYFEFFKPEFKSIAFSGWGPELIPDDEILQSQFPEILADMEQKRIRLAELSALFAATDEVEFEDGDETGILPDTEVKALKAELKEANAQAKLAKREQRNPSKFESHTQAAEQRLAKHKALEDEAKQLKADLRATEKKEEELVAAARKKIDRDEARRVILDLLHRILVQTYEGYLRADQRACLAALENLYGKYAVTAKVIERKRDAEGAKLKQFLVELGYA
ncbi:MAG: N-6 DNA methylase, partial [Nitrospirales bacterium]